MLPTGGLARSSGALAVESVRQVRPGPADHPRRPGGHRRDRHDPGRSGGAARPPRCRHPPLRTVHSADDAEAPTDEPDARHLHLTDRARLLQLGGDRRGGLRALRRADRADRPLRPEHVAGAAGARRARPGGGPIRDAAVRVRPVRLPTAHRGRRRPLRRRRPTRSSSARVRTRSSTSWARSSCRRARTAVVPTPSYAMYRVITEQRGATVDRRPTAQRPAEGYAMDVPAVRAAARHGRRRVAVQPEQPDRAAGTRRRDRDPPRRSRRGRRQPTAATPAIVVLDEAYAEFVDRSLVGLRERLPEPHRRAHREQGLRPRRPARRVRDRPARGHRPAEPVPAAGLGVDGVGDGRDGGPARPDGRGGQHRARRRRARAAAHRTDGARLGRGSIGHELRARRTSGRPSGPPRSPRACCATGSCRAPSRPAIRSPITCG